jgi:hypothetical protein
MAPSSQTADRGRDSVVEECYIIMFSAAVFFFPKFVVDGNATAGGGEGDVLFSCCC